MEIQHFAYFTHFSPQKISLPVFAILHFPMRLAPVVLVVLFKRKIAIERLVIVFYEIYRGRKIDSYVSLMHTFPAYNLVNLYLPIHLAPIVLFKRKFAIEWLVDTE